MAACYSTHGGPTYFQLFIYQMPCRYLFLLLLALAGCAASHPPRLQAPAGYCAPPLPYRYNPAYAPLPNFEAALTPALLVRYPRRNLLAANAVGILPALQTLLALQQTAQRQPGPAAELAVLQQRQRILAQEHRKQPGRRAGLRGRAGRPGGRLPGAARQPPHPAPQRAVHQRGGGQRHRHHGD